MRSTKSAVPTTGGRGVIHFHQSSFFAHHLRKDYFTTILRYACTHFYTICLSNQESYIPSTFNRMYD